jgi:type IV secretion system protein VirB4
MSTFHEGVVVHKDGLVQRTFTFKGPDLDAFDPFYLNELANALKRLEEGWAVQFEARRVYSRDYIGAAFERTAPFLIDRERELSFRRVGGHFEQEYYLTFTRKPPSAASRKATRFFFSGGEGKEAEPEIGSESAVRAFVEKSDEVVGILSSDVWLKPLGTAETVSFLHSAISMKRHPILFPTKSILLDYLLPDQQLETSLTMKLGECYIPIIGVRDFPMETYPGIFDALSKAGVEYRWVSRYICLDKEEALKVSEKKRKAHIGNATTWFQSLMSALTGEAARHLNKGALAKADDSDAVQAELEADAVSLGFYTTGVMVWDKSLKAAREKAAKVANIINSTGFVTTEETYNGLEAFKAMLPGNVYANVRKLRGTARRVYAESGTFGERGRDEPWTRAYALPPF